MALLAGSAPRVAIRVDASAVMGTGHLKRCLSLAHALLEQGAQVSLVSRSLDSVAAQVLLSAPCPVRWLPAPVAGTDLPLDHHSPPHAAWAGVAWALDALDTTTALQTERPDWLVVDHYALDARWHETLRAALGCRLLVIDDTSDRPLDPDVLLDQNWAPDHRAKYADLLAREPLWLVGPRYALLSPAYRSAPRYRFKPKVRSLGIFMGGTDPDSISARVLAACRTMGFSGGIEVVSTSTNPHLATLREACAADHSAALTLDEADLAAFFSRHDLQIGAGGGATWERCCIGAPTIAIAIAANQFAVVPGLGTLGALHATTEASLAETLRELICDPAARQALATRAAALVDSRGAQRVAMHIVREALTVRPATLDDSGLLLSWRNHLAVRAVSGSRGSITASEHNRWLQGVLLSQDRWLFVAQLGQLSIGSIRFDCLQTGRVAVSLYLDPELLGLGLGQRLLLAGERQMQQFLRSPFSLEATVMPGNTASQRLFEGCGYDGGPLNYQKAVGKLPPRAGANE